MRETEDHHLAAKGGKGVANYLTSHVEAFDRKKGFRAACDFYEADLRRTTTRTIHLFVKLEKVYTNKAKLI